ncbi:hypothetical protein PEPS_35010 (plasmid) [Persicobacter psychrovividus]|uniref:Uncharacterized protein n=1 Tax=Persicobacter psychrovividus TaxID=387638 RepID=A0ABN6LE37_9BACT|nr:hypothetical protein PEPS_35010 [Persicobacter psychrovividus]
MMRISEVMVLEMEWMITNMMCPQLKQWANNTKTR